MSDTQPFDATRISQARAAISAAFFLFGMVFGLWGAHIPTIAARVHLDPAVLGLALLMIGLAGVVSQPITGWLTPRFGSQRLAVILTPAMLASILIPIFAWNTAAVFIGTFVFGFISSGCNVALNTQASDIERARGKPTMSSFHGFFSLGALAGAALGGGIIAIGWQDGRGAAAAVAVAVIIVVVSARFYLPTEPARADATKGRRGFSLPPAMVIGLAAIAFVANMVEGAVADWSTLYLSTIRGIDPALAVSGYALYSLAMSICRLGGGPVVSALGERSILLFGGLLMAAGMAAVVFSPWNALSPFGFALVAIGAANNIPVLIGAAARVPGTTPGAGVATAATGALLGFLIGPPVIGFIAHAAGLAVALGLLCLSGIIIAVAAALYRWPAPVVREAVAA